MVYYFIKYSSLAYNHMLPMYCSVVQLCLTGYENQVLILTKYIYLKKLIKQNST